MRVFLETDRLTLRRFTMADVDNLVSLNADPEVMRFLPGDAARQTPVETVILPRFLSYYERFAGYGFWAVIEKASGDFLGWFHFRPSLDDPAPGEVELGYRLRRAAWGKGYATEGSRALISKGFTELGVHRVFAETMAGHAASRRVMEKSGLALVREYQESWPEQAGGGEHDLVEYALDKAGWELAQGA